MNRFARWMIEGLIEDEWLFGFVCGSLIVLFAEVLGFVIGILIW